MTTSPPKETPLRAAIGSRSLARESGVGRCENQQLSKILHSRRFLTDRSAESRLLRAPGPAYRSTCPIRDEGKDRLR